MITFNSIPANLMVPGQYIEIDNSQALQGLPAVPHKLLIIAPRLASGTLPALAVSRIRSASEAEAYLGRGSIGAAMAAAAKKANPYTDMYVIGISDADAGVAATGTLVITGPATDSGTLSVYIGGTRVQAAVATGDTATEVGDALAAAINANTALPVTAANVTGTVTVTSRHKGTVGNDVDVRLNYYYGDATPTGLSMVITALSGGATNPDLGTVVSAVADSWYHTVVTPYTDAANLTALEGWMLERFDGVEQKQGHVFGAHYGTLAAATTLAESRNSAFVTIMPTQKSPTPQWCVAAALAAIDAGQAESPTNCNRPRQTLPITGMLAPAEADRYDWSTRNSLLASRGSTFKVDEGGVCRIERLVTTYKTTNGVPDESYLDVEDMRNIAYLRYSLRVRIALRFPRYKLASDGFVVPPGQPIATPKTIRNELIALGKEWLEAGLIEDFEAFKSGLMVERDSTNLSQVNSILPPDLINGFRVFAAQIAFRK